MSQFSAPSETFMLVESPNAYNQIGTANGYRVAGVNNPGGTTSNYRRTPRFSVARRLL